MSGSSRRRRWLLAALGIAIALILVAGLLAPRLLRPERFRGRIESLLEQSTGWSARLGQIDLSVFGGLALRVAPVTLAAPGDSSQIEIDRLEVHARLLSLLGGKLEVTGVTLDRPAVRIVRESVEGGWILPGKREQGAPTQVGEPGLTVAAGTEAAAAPEKEGESEQAGAAAAEEATAPEKEGEPGQAVAPATEAATAPADGGGSFFDVQRVDLQQASLVLDDRSGAAPLVFGLEQMDARLNPADLSFTGEAAVSGDRGRVRFEGRWSGEMRIELDGVATSLLADLTDPALVHPRGTVSGTLSSRPEGIFAGELSFTELTLLAGERALGRATASFHVGGSGERWALEQLELDLDGVELTGTGELAPHLALELQAAAQPLDPLLGLTRAVLPLPLEIEPPGEWDGSLRFDRGEGGEVRYEAAGHFSASRLAATEVLPAVQQLETSFALDRGGQLAVTIEKGVVAEGPLSGRLTITPLVPPGRLAFRGGVEQAALGGLALPMMGQRARSLSGLTSLDAEIGADLGAEEISPAALNGRVELHAERLALAGWDIEGAIRKAARERLGKLGRLAGAGEADAKSAEGETALLDRLDAVLQLDGLPWRLEQVLLAGAGIEATGNGLLDPAAGMIDLDLRAVLDAARSAKLIARYPLLRSLRDGQQRLVLPLSAKGPFSAPSIGVDLSRIDAGGGAKEKARDKAKKLLRGLLDRKKR